MGTTYRFQCPSCKYEAKVSGGPDEGMMCSTETMSCNDCKCVVDVVVAYLFDGNEIDVLDGIDTELIKDGGPCDEYARLFMNQRIAAYKLPRNSCGQDLANRLQRGICHSCGENKSASGSPVTDAENLVWDNLCPECQHNEAAMYRGVGFTYFYMIKEAEKKGIKQKSNHCPICGQKIDHDAKNDYWSRQDGTFPCRKCLLELRSTRWTTRGALDMARSLNACRLCGSRNLTEWPSNGQGRCPKCGGEMLRKGLIEFWD